LAMDRIGGVEQLIENVADQVNGEGYQIVTGFFRMQFMINDRAYVAGEELGVALPDGGHLADTVGKLHEVTLKPHVFAEYLADPADKGADVVEQVLVFVDGGCQTRLQFHELMQDGQRDGLPPLWY